MTHSDKNRPGTTSTGAARHNTATARTFDDVLQELEARHRQWDRDHETPDATAWRDHYTNASPAWQTALADANTAGHKSGSIEAWDRVVALVQEPLIAYGRLLERHSRPRTAPPAAPHWTWRPVSTPLGRTIQLNITVINM